MELAEIRSHLGVTNPVVAPSHHKIEVAKRAKPAVLEADAIFILEKQKAENQVKMLQIQGEFVRVKRRTRVYED